MMDNKLSELSKPVDFLKAATLIAARNFERWSKLAALTSESSSVLHSTTLLETSQLLSALLAELEAKDKRIAELSRLLAHNIERAESAEKRLATPVRLNESTVMSRRYVVAAIEKAGFTVGDE